MVDWRLIDWFLFTCWACWISANLDSDRPIVSSYEKFRYHHHFQGTSENWTVCSCIWHSLTFLLPLALSFKLSTYAAFHSEPNMGRDTDTQHLWRQSIHSCRPQTMEQSSIAPERRWLIVQWIPAVDKDISVWTVGPRRSVNCINCTV